MFYKKYTTLIKSIINKLELKKVSSIYDKYLYFEKNLQSINLLFLSNYSGVLYKQLMLISFTEKDGRKEILEKLSINQDIYRTLIDYHRLKDAYFIANTVSNFEKLENLNILDFGCLVSDFGLFLGQFKTNIFLCDKKGIFLDFAERRLAAENVIVKDKYHVNDCTLEKIFANKDLVIFSEILEHLNDPLNLLKVCVANKTKYIYTSHYPYGNKNYFELSDHKKTAQEQSGACLDLLSLNYTPYLRRKKSILWVRK